MKKKKQKLKLKVVSEEQDYLERNLEAAKIDKANNLKSIKGWDFLISLIEKRLKEQLAK